MSGSLAPVEHCLRSHDPFRKYSGVTHSPGETGGKVRHPMSHELSIQLDIVLAQRYTEGWDIERHMQDPKEDQSELGGHASPKGTPASLAKILPLNELCKR